MRLLYADGVPMGRSGPIQLLHLENKWYVAGPGFLCAVEGQDEGAQLVHKLKIAQESGDSLIKCLDNGVNGNGAWPAASS